MNPDALRELVSRLTAGEELPAADEAALLGQLQRPGKRDPILADEAVDTLLRAAVHIPATSAEFVAAVVARAEEASAALFVFPTDTARKSRPARKSPRGRWLIPAACAAAVLIGLTVWQFAFRAPGGKGTDPAPVVKNAPVEKSVKPPPPIPERRLARLTKSEDAVWRTPVRAGEWLPPGTLHLIKGSADLEFDKGTVARVTGPTELDLCTGDEMFLRRGALAARVPPEAVGFTVRTPVGRVVDRGADFDIEVGEHGVTETVVHRGRLALTPQRDGERSAKTLELAAGGLDRASVSLPDFASPLLPLSTKARGGKGQFIGLVSVNGQTGVFQTPEAFQKFETTVLQQLRESPDQFRKQWSLNVQVSGRGSMAFAWVVINGERHQIEVYGDDADPRR